MENKRTKATNPRVLVVGAGVTGIRASLNLAEIGYDCLLVDQDDAAGGLIGQLEKQFPTNHCGLCRLRPMVGPDQAGEGCFRRGIIHDRVEFLPRTMVESISGAPGELRATLRITPVGIDPALCTACGKCEDVCPESGPDPFNCGLSRRKAVHLAAPFDPFGPRVIDWSICTLCGECAAVCPTAAVCLDSRPTTETISAAAVVWAAGRKLYNPDQTELYGRGFSPDVVTATAFERLISPLGPFAGCTDEGLPVRPSDGQPARRIAWVQCVGSRNIMIGADYCSSACCAFAVKEATLVRERSGGQAETSIFYMDMRTYGRDFQRYKDRAEEAGVRFVRCRVHSVDPADEPGELTIRYIDPAGNLITENFDLVVLSTGQAPGQDQARPAWTGHDGVLIADSALEFTDIAESLNGADAVSADVVQKLLDLEIRPGEISAQIEPPALSGESSRPNILTIFVSPDPKALDPSALENQLGADVRFETLIAPLDHELPAKIKARVTSVGADRLILLLPGKAATLYAVRTKAVELGLPAIFVETIDSAPWLKTAAVQGFRGLRDQIRIAAGRLAGRIAQPQPKIAVKTKPVVVVGGGPAGLSAALTLAAQGVPVHVVEKEPRIGSTADRLRLETDRKTVAELAEKALNHPGLTIHVSAQVARVRGSTGRFQLSLELADGSNETIEAGAVILATGGHAAHTDAYLLGSHDRVASAVDMARRNFKDDPPKEVVFILCAGSRTEPRNYCSRICCPAVLDTAIRIRTEAPGSKVTVFFRDVMTYGQSEHLYTQARQAGVSFIPFDPDTPPKTTIEDGRPTVEAFDPIMGENLRLKPDWLGLGVGIDPNPIAETARKFGVPTTVDGFYEEADVKWRPTDAMRSGVFVCGLGRAPARLTEAMREGRAAAGRALRMLRPENLTAGANTAYVDRGLCIACLLCLPACPFKARFASENGGPVWVDAAACRACGLCVDACPAGAALLPDRDDLGLLDAVKRALA